MCVCVCVCVDKWCVCMYLYMSMCTCYMYMSIVTYINEFSNNKMRNSKLKLWPMAGHYINNTNSCNYSPYSYHSLMLPQTPVEELTASYLVWLLLYICPKSETEFNTNLLDIYNRPKNSIVPQKVEVISNV